jgi:hypothetical protein
MEGTVIKPLVAEIGATHNIFPPRVWQKECDAPLPNVCLVPLGRPVERNEPVVSDDKFG